MRLSVIGFFILIFLLIAGWMESGGLTAEDLPPISKGYEKKVCLETITFNHDLICNRCDAINIRVNFTRDVHVPEWNRGKSYPAAYIRNKEVTIKAVFSAKPGLYTVRIGAARKNGDFGDLEEKLVYFEEDGNSKPVDFKIPSKTPDAVKSFCQEWDWYYRDINGSGSSKVHIMRSRNKIYIILAEPISPWETSGQAEPWTEALDWSCKWANGAKTPEEAAGKITKALFKTIGALYDTRKGSPRYTLCLEEEPFALTNFIDHFPKVGVVNCNDMGKALVTFSNVVGCCMSYRIVDAFGYVNCIHVIGRGWTNNPFYDRKKYKPIANKDSSSDRDPLGSHAFGQICDNIFDACFTVDIDSVPDYGPPFTEAWLINQTWSQYKMKVIDKKPCHSPKISKRYPFKFNVY